MATEIGFVVYKISCSKTKKVYIGQTCQELRRRWAAHKCKALRGDTSGCTALYSAIRKYGHDSFKIEALAALTTREEANAAEERLIAEYGSVSPGGYNLRAGGQASGHSPETRARMSASRQASGVGNSRSGKTLSCEARANISAGQKALAARGEHLFCKSKRTDEFDLRRTVAHHARVHRYAL